MNDAGVRRSSGRPPPQRGEIYMVYLDPAFGNEIGGYKVRPVAVVSINDLNDRGLPITVVPGSSSDRALGREPFKNTVTVEPDDQNRLLNRTVFYTHQIRAISPGRFTALPIGVLKRDSIQEIETAVRYCLALG